MAKRRGKPDLRCAWSKRERDYEYHYDRSQNGHWLHGMLHAAMAMAVDHKRRPFESGAVEAFRAEMRARGYDPDTFVMSVRRLPPPADVDFSPAIPRTSATSRK